MAPAFSLEHKSSSGRNFSFWKTQGAFWFLTLCGQWSIRKNNKSESGEAESFNWLHLKSKCVSWFSPLQNRQLPVKVQFKMTNKEHKLRKSFTNSFKAWHQIIFTQTITVCQKSVRLVHYNNTCKKHGRRFLKGALNLFGLL